MKTVHFHLMEIMHILMLFFELVLPQHNFSPMNLDRQISGKESAPRNTHFFFFIDSIILSGA